MYPTRAQVSGSPPPPSRRRLWRAFFATPRFLRRSRVRNTTMRSDSPSLYVLRISASVVCSGIRRRAGTILAQTELGQHAVVLAPLRLHANVEAQVDTRREEPFQ